jgi:hypothetical protein
MGLECAFSVNYLSQKYDFASETNGWYCTVWDHKLGLLERPANEFSANVRLQDSGLGFRLASSP